MLNFKNKVLNAAIFACFILVITIPCFALAQSDATLDRIVSQIEDLYPPVEGYVIAVELSLIHI